MDSLATEILAVIKAWNVKIITVFMTVGSAGRLGGEQQLGA
jgi:hypothetical protein